MASFTLRLCLVSLAILAMYVHHTEAISGLLVLLINSLITALNSILTNLMNMTEGLGNAATSTVNGVAQGANTAGQATFTGASRATSALIGENQVADSGANQ